MFYLARHLLGDVPGARFWAPVPPASYSPSIPGMWRQAMHHAHVSGIRIPAAVRAVLFSGAGAQKALPGLAGAGRRDADPVRFLSSWYFFFYTLYFMLFHLLSLRLGEGRWPRGWSLAATRYCVPAWPCCCCRPGWRPWRRRGSQSLLYYPGHNTFVADPTGAVCLPAHPSAGAVMAAASMPR